MDRETREPLSLRRAARCAAKTRSGTPCMKVRAKGRTRCKLHGGARGSGAPAGQRNGNFKHGLFAGENITERKRIKSLLQSIRGQ
jgi:glucans biosynthesis protein